MTGQFDDSRGSGIPIRSLYIYFAILIPAFVFGFWKTYFGRLDNLPDIVTPLIHAHSSLMILWIFMLIAQAWFVRTNRFRLHRWVGRSSFVMVPFMILGAMAATYESFNRTPEVNPQVARINVLAFGQILAFGVTWWLAIAYRKRIQLHVRFMISTAFAIATAIVFRIFFHWIPGFGALNAATAGNCGVLTLSLLVLITTDWRKGMRWSPYWIVASLLSVMHIGYWTFAKSDGWLIFCQWFADLPSWLFFH